MAVPGDHDRGQDKGNKVDMGDNIDKNDTRFVLAVNYWPAKKAMYWWQSFDAGEVESDFRKIADIGFKGVRIFLTWEDFQPEPDTVSPRALDDLACVADIADACGLWIMPTLFCGHMSGVNWMPGWMLEPGQSSGRFPIFSMGRLHNCQSQVVIRNFWMDKEVIRAQRLQCREVASTLQGHPAILAYDLGNESSNCAVPVDRSTARAWFKKMVLDIKRHSDGCAVTFGMHAEDLEEDRKLWPQDIGRFCDFLCMHGYPFYLSWADGPLDARVLPFLGAVTRWLGKKPVLLEEFGIPTLPDAINDHAGSRGGSASSASGTSRYLWQESDAVSFYRDAVNMLRNEGMLGAFAWCYSDYHPDLWDMPPLSCAPHERYFGIFRYDGTPKPVARVIRECSSLSLLRDCGSSWAEDDDPDEFYLCPESNLRRLYHRYKERFAGDLLRAGR